jgi:LEA14-like dessication related protein
LIKLTNMKKNLKYILLLATAGVTVTTAIWLKKQYNLLLKNVYTLKIFGIKKVSLNEIIINVVYDYVNNMDIDVNLASQEYKLYMDDKYIQTIKSDTLTVLKSKQTSEIPLDIKLNPKELYEKLKGNLVASIGGKQKVKIRMDAKFKVKLGFFKIPVPYSYEWTQTIPGLFGN